MPKEIHETVNSLSRKDEKAMKKRRRKKQRQLDRKKSTRNYDY
mgnify:FL=1|jgi:hypothetical protein